LDDDARAEQHRPAEDPVEDQIEEAERHVRDHVWPLRNADHCRSQAQADFWNPTSSARLDLRLDRRRPRYSTPDPLGAESGHVMRILLVPEAAEPIR
jgi:hypothetical protein